MYFVTFRILINDFLRSFINHFEIYFPKYFLITNNPAEDGENLGFKIVILF